jgi:hypothetical protein
MLPGALTGISYYLHPELSRLKETQVSHIFLQLIILQQKNFLRDSNK